MNPINLNLRSGNKAYIFTLDVLIGLFIVIGIVFIASNLINASGSAQLSKAQISKTGSDIVFTLYNDGTLDEVDLVLNELFNRNSIENKIGELLPGNLEMKLTIKYGSPVTEESFPNIVIPNDKFVGTGKMVFTKKDDGGALVFYDVRYQIWLK